MIKKAGLWFEDHVSCHAFDGIMRLAIYLENDSLTSPFIEISLNQIAIRFCINTYLDCLKHDSTIYIVLLSSNNKALKLVFETGTSALVFFAQIKLLSKISIYQVDPYETIRRSKDISSLLTTVDPVVFQVKQPKYAFPSIYHHYAMETWERRCDYTNLGFYTQFRSTTIAFITWNVSQQTPYISNPNKPTATIDVSFLFRYRKPILCLTLQEIEYSAKSLTLGSSYNSRSWNELIDKAASLFNYRSVKWEACGGVFIKILVRKDFGGKISNIKCENVRLGFGNYLANKSAIITTFTIDSATFAWAAAHFHSERSQVQVRNNTLTMIHNKLMKTEAVYKFLSGDLNYRIDLSYEDCVKFARHGVIKKILDYDQLIKNEDNKFLESIIKFQPTYKYDLNSNSFDTSKKHRVPSYTDRVLYLPSLKFVNKANIGLMSFETDVVRDFVTDFEYKTQPNLNLRLELNFPPDPKCQLYDSFQDVNFSDHRPVIAVFDLNIFMEDREKYYEYNEMKNFKKAELFNLYGKLVL